jgi:hypothetical protein
MNGTSPREDARHTLLSPQAKHAPIPPPPSSSVDDQVSHWKNFQTNLSIQYATTTTPRSGAMSISSLLTTEAPLSPTVAQTTPVSSRHSNIQLTASSSRPQRRKSSMDNPPPPMAVVSTKKRKREGDPDPELVINP